MAITDIQRGICRLIAANRMEREDGYVAGGTALNLLIESPRLSRDIDLFHDTREALASTWDADRGLLESNGYTIRVVRERPTFVEAIVGKGAKSVVMQWTCDSAYRFFPLMRHEDLGLTLHPLDLATNKALALVGRLEARDWIDFIQCHHKVQEAGYLIWAACGKDPGFGPEVVLNEAMRAGRYTQAEIDELSFCGPAPDAGALSRQWADMLQECGRVIGRLPPDEAGKCVLEVGGKLFRGDSEELPRALEADRIRFHSGSIRGAFPEFLG